MPRQQSKQTGSGPKASQPAARKQNNSKPKPRPKPQQDKDAKQDARIRQLEARTRGPEVKETWTTTVNLGTVSGTATDGFTRVAHVFLNPALLRDVDASDATNPTAVRAAQYAMYRVSSVELTMHSLVGSSGVAGAIGIAALQLDPSTGAAVSFDAVAARQHRTTGIGRDGSFRPRLPSGPDSWFYTDTKAHTGAEALGQALEVFILGATTNIYTNQAYTGSLWRLTLRVTYQFSNYKPDLALANLAAGQESHTIEVKTDEKGDVVVSTKVPLLGARFHTSAPGIADVVFSLVDVAGGLASQIPIIGPILDTGIAFLKPLFGRERATEDHQYLLCGSFDEAKIGDALTLAGPVEVTARGDFRIQQLTPAYLGAGGDPGPAPGPAPAVPRLPSVEIRMDALPAGRFLVTIPAWTTQVVNVPGSPAQHTITLKDAVAGSAGSAPAGPNGSKKVGTVWPLAGFNNQKVWMWMLCSGGTTNGANAILAHKADTTTLGSAGLLGTVAGLAADPSLIPRAPNVTTAFQFGWSEVAGVQGFNGLVKIGDLVIPVHFNNWFRANGTTGRQASTGMMFCRPSTQTVFVVGAYELPSDVATPGNGTAHFYTLLDTSGYVANGQRNTEPLASWLFSEEF
nr:MAG: structural polyprotein [Bat bastrovirus]